VKKVIAYTGALVALYLVVQNGSKSGQVISAGAKGYSDVIKSLQGR
jgi:hypothetical protein